MLYMPEPHMQVAYIFIYIKAPDFYDEMNKIYEHPESIRFKDM